MAQLPNWALNWKTDDMVAAEHTLDDAADQAETAMAEADRTLYEVESNERPVTPEEAEMMKQYASSDKAPPEWRELARRVERGEFGWTDYLQGKLDRDPGVVAALDASVRQAEEIEPGSAPPAAEAPGGRAAPPRPGRHRRDEGDEEEDLSERDWFS
ncbi:hypothetical protein ACFWY9_35595 [Amycolatopsis sp. NPDC059027]|uniref:hypothetical protein n=1 Tax=unclassified Amycolatopsis TaxID=2618356 RepID=UPI00366A6503